MSEKDQIDHMANEVWNVVDRFRSEYDLTIASAIGVLETVKLQLFLGETRKVEDEQ